MKHTLLLIVSISFFANLFSQTAEVPLGFTYQGVARTKNGKLLENQQLQVKVSLYQSGAQSILYGESHTVLTNRFGVFVLVVGQGTRYGGVVTDLKSVDFKNNQIDIKSEIQIAGAWETIGKQSQLWSVPYAFVAQKVIENDDADADPANEIQTLALNGNNLSLSKNGGSITLPADNDGDPQNEIQNLKLTDNTLTITNNTNATPIDLSKYQQSISLKNRILSISEGNTVTLPEDKDSSATNEIQDLKLTDDVLQITNNAKATPIDLTKYTKDAQILSLDGDSLVISGGNRVKMPTSRDNQTLKLFDTQLLISNGNAVDLSNILPAGMIIPFGGEEANIPDGWLVCNGASLSATKYPRLFLAIGTVWGGSGNIFNLPDLRGLFLRGVDGSRNIDPDADARTAMNTGGNTGDKVGTYEGDGFGSHGHGASADAQGSHSHGMSNPGDHTHLTPTYDIGSGYETTGSKTTGYNYSPSPPTSPAGNHVHTIYESGNHSHNISINASGISETRPKNASVVYIIKY